VPVLAGEDGLRLGKPGDGGAVFHALPAETRSPPASCVPLYEYRQRDGKGRAYSVDAGLVLQGYRREERPLCLVWQGPG
jgi:hypothetical protein